MREILFRGKRTDTGEWVEGYYVKGITKHGIVANFASFPRHVIPETVGQYTGLTDKNGKRIFEGDIVVKDGNPQYIFEVSYCEEYAGFYPFFDKDNECGYGVCGDNCCVIGNIHDNPELLNVEREDSE